MGITKSGSKSLAISASKTLSLGWGMVAVFVVFNALGAIIIKTQIQKMGEWHFNSIKSVISYFWVLFSAWQTWAGLMTIAMGTGAWMMALAHLELSKAYPVAIAFNLIIVVSVSLLHFQEPFTLSKIFGIFLILTGSTFLFR
ncbi:MAG: hypothetical protein K1X28_05320 [Parachlamydiales bacterium]|nr:hypothetical protein [Parachlamydiales bacterium]